MRYALSPYIKQIPFVFEGLNGARLGREQAVLSYWMSSHGSRE
jgi:hypothetical protein